jgi:ATP-dependent DNA helicase RecG
VSVSNNLLLEKLRLIEGTYLKRAALLLFHPDPEAFFTGAYIKIGFFRTHTDLLYHDTIHGNLFEQVDKTMDLLLTKYMKALISYEGIHRVETYPFPEEAIREAVINAVIHKDYGCGIPIQISVYDNQFYIWNQGQLPDDWTVEKLLDKHPSHPYNPDIANTFFRAGYIESWGRGMKKIIDECTNAGLPEPTFDYDANGLMVEFKGKPVVETEILDEHRENGGDLAVKWRESGGIMAVKILEAVKANRDITIPQLATNIGEPIRTVERKIQKLRKDNLLIRVGAANGGSWEIKE